MGIAFYKWSALKDDFFNEESNGENRILMIKSSSFEISVKNLKKPLKKSLSNVARNSLVLLSINKLE